MTILSSNIQTRHQAKSVTWANSYVASLGARDTAEAVHGKLLELLKSNLHKKIEWTEGLSFEKAHTILHKARKVFSLDG